MKLGITNWDYIKAYPKAEAYRIMKSQGYDFADYQQFINTESNFFRSPLAQFEREIIEERKLAEDAGIAFSQAHGPWRHPTRDLDPADRAERMESMKRSIYGTAVLGCKNWVIHPLMPYGSGSPDHPEEVLEINRAFFSEICDYAKTMGITVCFENMPFLQLPLSSTAQIVSFVRELNRDNFKVCLDTGHSIVWGEQAADAVRLIGKELLTVLHIHDNDGSYDRHLQPEKGIIDWTAFAAALREIGFEGVCSLECAPIREKDHPELWREAELELANTAKRLFCSARVTE